MNIELLEKLAGIPGVPGREHRIRDFILQETQGLFDEVSVDPLGSIIGIKKPTKPSDKPTRVMLAAHMDQIGFIVRFIDDKGYLKLQNVGGFDTRNLFARLVTISPDLADPSKDFTGVLTPATKPVHIATDEDKNKIPKIEEFYVDTGLEADDVKSRVKIGDMVTLQARLVELGNNVVSQCMDNRIACWIVIEALRQLQSSNVEIHCVFTVQEEVGLRGAHASSFTVAPDIGIAIDTTLACDTPGIPEDLATSKLGGGAGITVLDSSAINNYELVETFASIAAEREIPHQRSALTRGGTDAGGMQRTRSGCKTFTLSCPTRYIHTVTEMISKTDMAACRDLLTAYLETAE